MLEYIEHTTEDNVTNQTLAAMNKLVAKVKQSKEVGISYMKSWEYEQMITERATREGMEQGLKQGIEQGLKALIQSFQELHMSKEEALHQTIAKFQLSEEKAAEYVDRYWQTEMPLQ